MSYYRAYVSSDPFCKKDCNALPGLDGIGCQLKKKTLGCAGGIFPEVKGVVTPSGTGGEAINPASGCTSGDLLCEGGHYFQAGGQGAAGGVSNFFGSLGSTFSGAGPFGIPWVILLAGAGIAAVALILVIKK